MLVNASCISPAGSFPAMARTPADRLREARADAGFERASEAARSLGVPEQTYLAHENGSRGITAKAGEHYANRFKVEFTWLMTNKGPKRIGAGAGAASGTSQASATGIAHRTVAPDMHLSMRQIPVIGFVQAGVWLHTVELPPADRFDVPLPIQSGFDGFVVQGLVVRGPSMDEIYPHGSILAVVSFMDLGRDPRNGERVVALRHRQAHRSSGTSSLGWKSAFRTPCMVASPWL